MPHRLIWALVGAGVLVVIVVMCSLVYLLLNPTVQDPDGYAKITGKCGDTMEISLKFKNGRVCETSFWTDGCAHSYNSICAAADLSKGKTPDEILEIDAEAIKDYIGGLPSDHLHCAKLAEETLQQALHNYMVKMTKGERSGEGKEAKYCVDT